MSTNPRTKIQPVLVEVSLRNAIARRLRERGIPEFDTIADEVTYELTQKVVVNPPTGVPHTFTIEGVKLTWPQGLDTRVPTPDEYAPLNRALDKIARWNDRITPEDNVRGLRVCYVALWGYARIQANERAEAMKVQAPSAPVVTTSMLEGRNPVLEASVTPDGEVQVKPKRTRKKAEPKVEPVVSTETTLNALEAALADMRKATEGV